MISKNGTFQTNWVSIQMCHKYFQCYHTYLIVISINISSKFSKTVYHGEGLGRLLHIFCQVIYFCLSFIFLRIHFPREVSKSDIVAVEQNCLVCQLLEYCHNIFLYSQNIALTSYYEIFQKLRIVYCWFFSITNYTILK